MLQRFENDAVQKVMGNTVHCSGHESMNNDVEILKHLVGDPPKSLQEVKFLAPCVSFLFI